MQAVKEKIEMWLKPRLEEMNCYLVDVRVLNGNSKIEVYIDNNERPVNIQECEVVSRFLEMHLDTDEAVSKNYVLDVSSPGMENPFKVPKQYEKNIGRTVEVLMNDGNRKEGILKYADALKLKIEIYHQPKKKHLKPEITMEEIPFSEIKTVKKKITF